mmetsp:Transcript_36652/g.105014  ORF Transcript_36652/g.105014 Transcript_36652/m.105014 type:complete len:281 (+) Transcript_36652:544-1386(+)
MARDSTSTHNQWSRKGGLTQWRPPPVCILAANYSTDRQLPGLDCIVSSFGYGMNISWSLMLSMDRAAWLFDATCREKLALDLKASAGSNAVVCAVINMPLISVQCRAIRTTVWVSSWLPSPHSSTRYTPLTSFLLPVTTPPLARLCSKHRVNVPLPSPMPWPPSTSISLVEQAAVMPLTVPFLPRFTTLWPLKDTTAGKGPVVRVLAAESWYRVGERSASLDAVLRVEVTSLISPKHGRGTVLRVERDAIAVSVSQSILRRAVGRQITHRADDVEGARYD